MQGNYESSANQDPSLDKPCSYCKVLQLDDAKTGGSIQVTAGGKRYVSFGEVQQSAFDHSGQSPNVRWFHPRPDEVRQYPKLEVELGYERDDTFPDLPKLAATASQGCQFCVVLRNDLLSVWQSRIQKQVKRPPALTRISKDDQELSGEELEPRDLLRPNQLIITEIVYQYRDHSGDDVETPIEQKPWLDTLLVYFKVALRKHELRYSLHYNFHADPSDPCATWLNIWRLPVPSAALSGPRLERLTSLIQKSFPHHPPSKTNTYLPTRLIDVCPCGSLTPRLVISDRLPPVTETDEISTRQYVALSYCWGPTEDAKKQLKTTKATFNDHLRGIEFDKMPKTISDAIQVCRLLGVRYIWIDALCIIQGDKDDWNREAFEMSNVYANSFLTLCVLRGNSCLSGFLTPQDVQPKLNLHFRSSLDPLVSGNLCLSMLNHPDRSLENPCSNLGGKARSFTDEPADNDIDDAPWSTRGWTFQEARLSPRKVLFGDRMFHVSCGGIHESEDGTHFSSYFWGAPLSQALSEDKLDFEAAMRGWYSTVGSYVRRELSYVQDRLPAISALARRISDGYPGEKYLAGLWESDLSSGLLWSNNTNKEHGAYIKDLAKNYVAPTWSWTCQPYMLRWVWGVGLQDHTFNPEFKVRDCKLITDALNPYGCVYGGYLMLHAKAVPLPLLHDGKPKVSTAPESEYTWLGIIFHFLLRSEADEYIAHMHLDWDQLGVQKTAEYPNGPIERLWMVLVSSSNLNKADMGNRSYLTDSEIMLGLLLLPTDNGQEFIKVGLWYSENRGLGGRKFWDNIQPRDVKLV